LFVRAISDSDISIRYDYAWKYVTQYMKKIDGGNENLIKAIFVDNPKRLLTVV